MPTYTYQCRCGHKEDHLHGARETLQLQHCGRTCMTKQFPCPAVHTDTSFMSNSVEMDGLPDPRSRKIALAKAKAAGVNVQGKRFSPGMCRTGNAFDPYAWIGSKAEVKKKHEQQGWGCAEFGVKQREREEAPGPYRVADDIVQKEVGDIVTEQHGGHVTDQQRQDLTEAAQTRLAGHMAEA